MGELRRNLAAVRRWCSPSPAPRHIPSGLAALMMVGLVGCGGPDTIPTAPAAQATGSAPATGSASAPPPTQPSASPPVVCGPGTVLQNGACVVAPQSGCPGDSRWDGTRCVVGMPCGPGKIWNGHLCAPDTLEQQSEHWHCSATDAAPRWWYCFPDRARCQKEMSIESHSECAPFLHVYCMVNRATGKQQRCVPTLALCEYYYMPSKERCELRK